MRRALIALAVLLVLIAGGYVAGLRLARAGEERALREPWPDGAGAIADAASRYPRQELSPSAQRLTQLARFFRLPLAPKTEGDPSIAEPLKRDLEPYVRVQLARASFAIDPPPPLLASIFATPHFAAIRAELLRGEPIFWPQRYEPSGPIPNLVGHLAMHRLLIASALDRARRGDPGAWDDLRASRELNRSLWSRHELISHIIALHATRMNVAAARKLPPPAPPWFEEMLSEEVAPRFVRSLQAEMSLAQGLPDPSSGGLPEPLVRASAANALNLARDLAASASAPGCALEAAAFEKRVGEQIPWWDTTTPVALPSLGSVWQRIARYRAEREATRIALAVRAGAQPALGSSCSDRKWIADGTKVRLDRPLPPVAARDLEIPLEVPLRE